MKRRFYLEEFHGFKRQVYFDTSHNWQRSKARCELCDVLFVVFSTTGGFSMRTTLLQAKLSRETHAAGLTTHVGRIERQEFKGNYEQWDLLCARPAIEATTVFDPPMHLLSGAVLSTVGTFGVFHQAPTGLVDFFYISADCLSPSATPTRPDTRIGRLLSTHGGPSKRSSGPWTEVTYCPTALSFAKSLYEMTIGTPVVHAPVGGKRRDYQPHSDWVRGILTSYLSTTVGDSTVARDLLAYLGRANLPDTAKVPSLVLLRSEQPVEGASTDGFG